MCGINVIVDKRGNLSPDAIGKMTRCTTHRGPDHSQNLHQKVNGTNFYFGHNRLRIIDLSENADQPLWTEDGRYMLLYNGEIYNYRELRKEIKDYPFKTDSDTEVVLALLAKTGLAGLRKLNGMFALVLFDKQEGTLMAARDRFGVKPLYYYSAEDLLIISSEIQAILSSGLVQKKLNKNQLPYYLTFKFAQKPETFYQEILELEEGKFLTFSNNNLGVESYLPERNSLTSQIAADQTALLKTTEELLVKSVERQLISDVPVGLFLSGGVDSTLLLAILAELGHKNFPTFSVNALPEEQSFGTQDNVYAPMASTLFQSDHTSFNITDDLLKLFPEVVNGLDQPIADSAALLTYYMSREARKSVSVALSGAGADELFAGYNRHWAFFRYMRHKNKFNTLLPLLRTGAKMLPTGVHHPLRKQFQLIKKMAPGISVSAKETFRNFTALQPELKQLLTEPYNHSSINSAEEDTATNQALHWALQHDLHCYLISDVLALTDKMSMRHSLEVRVPYLDAELTGYLNTLPAEELFKNGKKWILKDLLTKRGGQAFANRRKEGLGLPLGAWLRKPTNKWFLEPVQNSRHLLFNYLDYNRTQQLLQAHLKSRNDYSLEIWALAVLAWWLEKEFS